MTSCCTVTSEIRLEGTSRFYLRLEGTSAHAFKGFLKSYASSPTGLSDAGPVCYEQCKRKKQTREGAPRSPRYGHYPTHARSLYGQNRSHQSPSQLFQCRHEALLPSDDTKTAGRKTRTSLSFQKPPLFNFQITLSKLLISP